MQQDNESSQEQINSFETQLKSETNRREDIEQEVTKQKQVGILHRLLHVLISPLFVQVLVMAPAMFHVSEIVNSILYVGNLL